MSNRTYSQYNYEQFLMLLAVEERNILHRAFYENLCKEHPNDIVISRWEGRREQKWQDEGKHHFSRFYCEFDAAWAYRTTDPSASPILVGYELKGTHRRGKTGKYDPALIHEGLGQTDFMLEQDADYVYLVRPRTRKDDDDAKLIDVVSKKPYHGLVFVEQVNGNMEFREAVTPKQANPNINLDRKKINLAIACMFKKGHARIQKQEWARKAEFTLVTP